jgi:hypothetical protein
MSTITFNALISSSGSAWLTVVLLVDLNCDGTTFAVLQTNGAALAANVTPISGSSFLSYNASFNQDIWQSSGGAIVNSSGTLVPSASSSSTATLTALIAASPNICIVNQASGDPGLPNALPTAGILFSLGSASTIDFNSAFINSIGIGAKTINSSQWNAQ